MRSDIGYLGCTLACLVAATVFVARGPKRGMGDSHDFGTVYAASRAWMNGQNPYDHAVLSDTWIKADGPADRTPSATLTPSVYPPTAFVMAAPFALLRWPTARLVWCLVNVGVLLGMVDGIRRLAGLRYGEPRTLLLLAGTLALRPISSSFELGQTSVLATALGAWAIIASGNGRRSLAGCAHAIALAAKITVAAAFLLPDLASRRWRSPILAGVLLAGCAAISIVRMNDPAAAGRAWTENLKVATQIGGVNDPSVENPSRHQLINLQYPLSSFITNKRVVDLTTWVLVGAMMIPAGLFLWRRPAGSDLLLPVSIVAMAQGLAVYHRLYDAAILVFPLAWALLPSTRSWQRWPTLLLLALFMIPGTTPPAAGSAWHERPFWNYVIVPHEAWALLLLLGWTSACQWYALAKKPLPASGQARKPESSMPARGSPSTDELNTTRALKSSKTFNRTTGAVRCP